MKFGQSKTRNIYGEDGEVNDIDIVHEGASVGKLKQFKVKHIVKSAKDETSVYLKWANEMQQKRDSGVLAVIKDEPETLPHYQIRFPKNNVDGSYLVITSWTERA